MNLYENGKIYKIISSQTDKIYIGSTVEKRLSQRLVKHRYEYRKWKASNKCHFVSSFYLLEYDDAKIILIKNFPCQSKDELLAEEQKCIDENRDLCVNMHSALTGLTIPEYKKEYRKTEKSKIYRSSLFHCDYCHVDILIVNRARHLACKMHLENVEEINEINEGYKL